MKLKQEKNTQETKLRSNSYKWYNICTIYYAVNPHGKSVFRNSLDMFPRLNTAFNLVSPYLQTNCHFINFLGSL